MQLLNFFQHIFGAAIPVLCYHQVRPNSFMTPQRFGQHLDLLQHLGFQTISLDKLFTVIANKSQLETPSVVITFDDCTVDNWIYAVPELMRRNMVGVFFAITDFVQPGPMRLRADETKNPPCVPEFSEIMRQAIKDNMHGFMHQTEIQSLVHDLGMEVYSHSAAHQACFISTSSTGTLATSTHWSHHALTGQKHPQTPTYPVGSAYAHSGFGLDWQGQTLKLAAREERLAFCLRDFSRSKQTLESLLDKPCPYLCLPWGEHDRLTLDAARQAGYTGSLTLQRTLVGPGINPFQVGRLAVKDKKSNTWLQVRTLLMSTKVSARLMSLGRTHKI